ncbi:Cation/H+ exchanger [Cunninghamella echinulata]|nr:Cation/H+ exchanger [Cunninghamella echinulata]
MEVGEDLRVGFIVGVLGVIIPFGSIFGITRAFSFSYTESIFIALSMSATSIAVSVQTLKELDRLKENSVLIIIATIDDIVIIMSLSIFTAITSSELSEIGITIGRMVTFFIVLGAVVWYLRSYFIRMIRWLFRDEEDINIIVFAIIIGYSLVAEVGGKVSMITGAFIIGMILRQTDLVIEDMSNSFFVTIFFATIGIFINLRELQTESAIFGVVLIVGCIITKIVSGFLGCMLFGNHWKKSLIIGIGMVGRGEVGLILAAQGLQSNIISSDIYTVLTLIVIITTIITPLMLRCFYHIVGN